ncbi:MAG: hypothetical protein KIT09_07140 [Bryobacteraceae bacterium]|nr:hypothetical protein [Bryobacteraceae bacterium]
MQKAMIDYDEILFWGFATALSLVGVGGGLAFVFATKKAVRIQARYNALLNEESANNPVVIWQYRIIGGLIGLFALFFLLLAGPALFKALRGSL